MMGPVAGATEMTDPHAPFLAAILAEPAKDAPRLVYADYLDENGQGGRAEFIRVQCDEFDAAEQSCYCGNSTDPTGCGRCQRVRKLRKRERALLSDLRPSLLAELPVFYIGSRPIGWGTCIGRHFADFASDDFIIGYDRGFAQRCSMPSEWLNVLSALLAIAPIREVWLTTPPRFQVWYEPENRCSVVQLEYSGCQENFRVSDLELIATYPRDRTVSATNSTRDYLFSREWPTVQVWHWPT